MHGFLLAFGWGLFSGSALVIGALFGYFAKFQQRVIAWIMAFGSGVLVATLSFSLVEDAYKVGGFDATVIGFLSGAILFTIGNYIISRKGGKHRKRSDELQVSEEESAGSGKAIALGALLDGIPESIVIGISLIGNQSVNLVTVLAIFISNFPEGLSSAAGMKKSKRSARYIFTLWSGIALISGAASVAGYGLVEHFSDDTRAIITAIAAGAVLTMVVDTMIPEAYAESHDFAGLSTVAGYLTAYFLTKI